MRIYSMNPVTLFTVFYGFWLLVAFKSLLHQRMTYVNIPSQAFSPHFLMFFFFRETQQNQQLFLEQSKPGFVPPLLHEINGKKPDRQRPGLDCIFSVHGKN